jgi:hypothetical protein
MVLTNPRYQQPILGQIPYHNVCPFFALDARSACLCVAAHTFQSWPNCAHVVSLCDRTLFCVTAHIVSLCDRTPLVWLRTPMCDRTHCVFVWPHTWPPLFAWPHTLCLCVTAHIMSLCDRTHCVFVWPHTSCVIAHSFVWPHTPCATAHLTANPRVTAHSYVWPHTPCVTARSGAQGRRLCREQFCCEGKVCLWYLIHCSLLSLALWI